MPRCRQCGTLIFIFQHTDGVVYLLEKVPGKRGVLDGHTCKYNKALSKNMLKEYDLRPGINYDEDDSEEGRKSQ